MAVGKRAVEMRDEILDLLRKMPRVGKAAAGDGVRRARIATGRASEPEIDAAGIKRFQHAKRLGDAKRAVVGKENAASAHAHAARLRAKARKENLRTRIGERGDGVVLGEPVAVIAERIGTPRERERLLDGAARALPVDHRGLVENRKAHGVAMLMDRRVLSIA